MSRDTTEDHTHWGSDIWLCKRPRSARELSFWCPPEDIGAWVQTDIPLSRGWHARPTAVGAFEKWLRRYPAMRPADVESRHGKAAMEFAALSARVPTGQPFARRTRDQTVLNQAIAWIDTAVGGLFKGLFLTPTHTPSGSMTDQLRAGFRQRLCNVLDLPSSAHPAPFCDVQLTRMYNSRVRISDGQFVTYVTRVGQSELWRDRWAWLSDDIAPSDVREALSRAARVLASPFMVRELVCTLQENDEAGRYIALCVLRRLLLTLRTMAWAELALDNKHKHIRPLDLNCFAFAALKPEWPRRLVALSHRSQDVKPRLTSTSFWRSPLSAVDATYAPQWETNVGMIWSLFAPALVIVRMRSPTYLKSDWCARESEMLSYLRDKSDFMPRILVDAGPNKIGDLDEFLGNNSSSDVTFPPEVELLEPPPVSNLNGTTLAAAAAIRALGLMFGQARANAAAMLLLDGKTPPLPCITNNPDGWKPYIGVFTQLRSCMADAEPPLLLHSEQNAEELHWEAENADKFPDLSDGVVDVRDALAAQEWMRVEHSYHWHRGLGRQIAIDCRAISLDHWTKEKPLTLSRGLASISTAVPVWFIQRANSRVDHWPGIGDRRPIFTQHVESQFSWMRLTRPPPNWFESYLGRNGLRVSASLIRAAKHPD